MHCFHIFHSYKIVAVFHYLDNSYSNYVFPSTIVTRKCKYCEKIKITTLYGVGYLTLE